MRELWRCHRYVWSASSHTPLYHDSSRGIPVSALRIRASPASMSFASQSSSDPTSPSPSSAASESKEQPRAATNVAGSTGSGGRRRHRFNAAATVEEIPSFRDFQQKKQVWSLYRQFTRLVYQCTATVNSNNKDTESNSNRSNSSNNISNSTRTDMQGKIRHEFRLAQSDNWHVQRALSEGSRRYKELSAMLGNSVKRTSTMTTNPVSAATATATSNATIETTVPPASTTNKWPWNSPQPPSSHNDGKPKRPVVFPRKSNS